MPDTDYLSAGLLGIVEGLTEFLPVSSTGHLLIAEHLLGLPMRTQQEKDSLIGFTAVIQTGAILAAVLFFLREIVTVVGDFAGGLASSAKRFAKSDGIDFQSGPPCPQTAELPKT